MGLNVSRRDDVLLVEAREEASDAIWAALGGRLLESIGAAPTRGVVVDVTALGVLDSYVGKMLCDLGARLRQHGVVTVVVGIQPEVALAMVRLGLSLEGVETAIDVTGALRIIERGLELGDA